jgi:hypothetical protein
VSIARIDIRRVQNFGLVLGDALARDFGYVAALHADIRMVDSSDGLLKEISKIGSRQMLYFGHGGGAGVGIFPEGLSGAAVSEQEIGRALAKDAPEPILVACWGGSLSIPRSGLVTRTTGSLKMIAWDDAEFAVTAAGLKKVRTNQPLSAKDLILKGIQLTQTGKAVAPQVPLREHQPGGPR